jgi:CRISPR system Cascade subunit CasE
MFLSRVELGPRAAERNAFWREVSQPYGAHQALWKLLSRDPSQARDFLYRAEERAPRPSFLVLSASEPPPDRTGLWRIEPKRFSPLLRAGQRLGFALRASPVVRRMEGEGDAARTRRHDVVMDRKKQLARAGTPVSNREGVIREAGLAWLRAQGERSGFRLTDVEWDVVERDVIGDDGLLVATKEPAVRVEGYRQHRILRRGERAITFSTLEFEGILDVVDPDAFLARVRRGFGPQKAFGCGLMLLRRA